MNPDEASSLLGVAPDADPRTVRRAWRMWARLSHPDVGGEAEHFAQLDLARRVLLAQRPLTPVVETPRLALREVLVMPAHRILLLLGALACVSLSTAGLMLAPVISALFASTAAAAWAWWAVREALGPLADRGHRIAMLALVWLPVWVLQVGLSSALGVSLVPLLPLTALPLAAAVAAVNPGAGLWRPR